MERTKIARQPGYVNPELAEILKSSGPVRGLDATTDIVGLRKQLRERKLALTSAHKKGTTNITENDMRIKTRDGSEILIRIYQRAQGDQGPVMVMLHGGGWILGDLDNEALLCRRWCEECGGLSINVEYRLAPEYKFPTAVFDCYDAVLWTAKHVHNYGGDLAKGFVIAGVSAGANMAATLSHLYRDEGFLPRLTGLYLSIPSLLAPEAVPPEYKGEYLSRQENKDAPVLNSAAIKWFRDCYQDDPRSPLMSPFVFETGHAGLPPTYFQVAGMDPLRDEALIYERVLREECNVPTRLDLYPGLPHGFWSWWPTAGFSKKQAQDSMAGLKWLLIADSQSA
ncbi:hypothetical protein H2204_001685 [Knufia peltigerae]|uniref:Alpha/beta hydrolase fold-3 domain-containing protein n=1 Tax=Knufia peltigerae TaxID=1002370 RepID=A0AA38YCX1_9EURO|nr:hypothetical protein H2204_001685 [Knufia peltigerae]